MKKKKPEVDIFEEEMDEVKMVAYMTRECPECGSSSFRRRVIPNEVGRGTREVTLCSECGYEED